MNSTHPLTGLTCTSCAAKVQAALAPLAQSVTVTHSPQQVTFSGPTLPTEAQITAALAPFGGKYALAPNNAKGAKPKAPNPLKTWLKTYQPLLLIAAYISVASLAGAHSFEDWMRHFMAGFFLVFSGFKLLNLKGFADGYATYDLIAARSRAYALAYPFLELALGLAFLFNLAPVATNAVTLVLMLVSAVGVWRSLQRKQKLQCACLGTALNLPLGTVTLIEDLLMAAMAALMLLHLTT